MMKTLSCKFEFLARATSKTCYLNIWSNVRSESTGLVCFEHLNNPLRLSKITGSTKFRDVSGGDWKAPDYAARDQSLTNVSVNQVQASLPKLNEARLQKIPEGHVIFFWTMSASFRVEAPKGILENETQALRGDDEYNANVRDVQGNIIGTLSRMGKSHWSQASVSDGPQTFIEIARRSVPFSPTYVTALQVRWEDNIAYRVNIADIEEDGWMAANPQRKLVALM